VRVVGSLTVIEAHAPTASVNPIATTDIEMRTVRDNEFAAPRRHYFDALLFYPFGAVHASILDGVISCKGEAGRSVAKSGILGRSVRCKGTPAMIAEARFGRG